jgi:CTP synthase
MNSIQQLKNLVENGLKIAGGNPQTGLVEIAELCAYRWFVAVQFHPECLSKPTVAHPLFVNFIEVALQI